MHLHSPKYFRIYQIAMTLMSSLAMGLTFFLTGFFGPTVFILFCGTLIFYFIHKKYHAFYLLLDDIPQVRLTRGMLVSSVTGASIMAILFIAMLYYTQLSDAQTAEGVNKIMMVYLWGIVAVHALSALILGIIDSATFSRDMWEIPLMCFKAFVFYAMSAFICFAVYLMLLVLSMVIFRISIIP